MFFWRTIVLWGASFITKVMNTEKNYLVYSFLFYGQLGIWWAVPNGHCLIPTCKRVSWIVHFNESINSTSNNTDYGFLRKLINVLNYRRGLLSKRTDASNIRITINNVTQILICLNRGVHILAYWLSTIKNLYCSVRPSA